MRDKGLLLLTLLLLLLSNVAFANSVELESGHLWTILMLYLASLGFAIGMGVLAQSRVVSCALESIGRNPTAAEKIFMPMILGLALIESLIIFMFISIVMVR